MAIAVGVHWKLLIRKGREVLICLLEDPSARVTKVSQEVSPWGLVLGNIYLLSQGPSDKPKFYSTKVHPGKPMSLLILFAEQWMGVMGRRVGAFKTAALEGQYTA